MSLVLDGIIIALVVLSAVFAGKKGFVRSLIECVGYVLAVIIAVNVAGIVSGTVYDNYIKPTVVDAISSAVTQGSSNAVQAVPDSVVSLVELAGVDFDKINTQIGETAVDTATRVAETVVKPVAIGIVNSLSIIIISVVLFIVVGFLAKIINSFFKGAVFGTANRTLGAVIGAAKGLVFAVIFSLIVSFVASANIDGFTMFTNDTIESSYICKYILNFIESNF